jgi:hypothetical protein
MRAFADNMAGDYATEQPAGRLRTLLRVRIKLGACHIAMIVEVSLDDIEYARQILAKPMLFRVIAHHIGAADIGFPFVEHRPEIEEHGFVLGYRADRRILREDADGVRTGANDPLVPVLAYTK